MKKQLISGMCLAMVAAPTALMAGNNFEDLADIDQEQFDDVTEYLGAATSYKAVSPAEPLGLAGFDVALELTATKLDKELFDEVADGDWDLSYLPLPKLHVHKGLPFGVDIGAFLSAVPETDIRVFGGEVRYAILEGSTVTPALAIRATYSRLEGEDELELDNKGIELTVSKGFVMATPYAAIGMVRTVGEAVEEDGLNKAIIDSTKMVVGVNLNLGMNFGLEADRTGDVTSFSVKTGLRF